MFRIHEHRAFRAACVAGIYGLASLVAGCGADANTGAVGATGGSAGAGGGYVAPGGGGVTSLAPGGGGAPLGAGGLLGGAGMGTAGMGFGGNVTVMGFGGTGVAGMGVAGMGAGGLGVAGAAGAGGLIGMGMGGTAGAAATGGAAGAGGGEMMHPDEGVGTGTDVVLLGDSWMSNTLQIEGTGGGIAPALIAAAGKPYRNYAVQGVMMLMADAFGPAIPTQYDQAKTVNKDIKTVVMTGGGNDIIQNATIQQSCTTGGDACKMLLMQISDAMNTLWTKMADDKVLDIVYIQYASDVGSTDPSVRMSMATPAICTTGRIRCHSVDTTTAVMKQIAGDGIHPLQAANTRIAKQVYDLMTMQGIRR